MPTQSFGNCHAGQLPLPLTRERPALTYPDRIIGPGRSLSRPSDMAAQEEARVNPRIGREIHGMRPDDRGHHRDGHRFCLFIHAHNVGIKHKIQITDRALSWTEYPALKCSQARRHRPTAVFIVGSSRSGGAYALQWVRREFPATSRPGHFKTRPLQELRLHECAHGRYTKLRRRRKHRTVPSRSSPSSRGRPS